MNNCAIIPVSRFSQAKTRLSPTLTTTRKRKPIKIHVKGCYKGFKKKVGPSLVISADPDVLEYVEKLKVSIT